MAVVILRVYKNMKLVTTKLKSGGLHEKHAVATWNLGNHRLLVKKKKRHSFRNVTFGKTLDGAQCLEISCVTGTKNRGIVVGVMTTLKAGRSVFYFLGRGEIFSVLRNM